MAFRKITQDLMKKESVFIDSMFIIEAYVFSYTHFEAAWNIPIMLFKQFNNIVKIREKAKKRIGAFINA